MHVPLEGASGWHGACPYTGQPHRSEISDLLKPSRSWFFVKKNDVLICFFCFYLFWEYAKRSVCLIPPTRFCGWDNGKRLCLLWDIDSYNRFRATCKRMRRVDPSLSSARGKVKITSVFVKIPSVFIKIPSVFDKIPSVFAIFSRFS